MKKQRMSWIDMARGYGIILVIIGHIGLSTNDIGRYFYAWIYTFHLPMFFFVSGYLFSIGKSFKDFSAKAVKRLVVPYFSLAAVSFVYQTVMELIDGKFRLKNTLLLIVKILLQRRLWTVWFLACLFVVFMLMYVMVRFIRNETLLAACAFLMGIAAMVYYHFGGMPLLWDFDAAFAVMPFFCGGYLFRRQSDRIRLILDDRRRLLITFLILLALNLCAGALNCKMTGTTIDMYQRRYCIVPLMWLAAFAGTGAMLIFARRFTIRPIEFIGANTMIYFGWHKEVVIPLISRILRLMGFTISGGSSFIKILLYWTVEVVAALGILTAVTMLIDRSRLCVLFGKKAPVQAGKKQQTYKHFR